MPEMRSLPLLATILLLPLCACYAQDENVYVDGDPWYIIDPGLYESTNAGANNGVDMADDMPPAPITPLDGTWDGPQEIGGCIDSASWLEFASNGTFRYHFLQADACIEDEARGHFPCEGTWSRDPTGDVYQGSMTYACQSERQVPSTPDIRGLTASYMIVGGDLPSLTFKAWLRQEDGSWVRTRQEVQEYPPSVEGFPREQSTTDLTSTLRLSTAAGQPLESFDDFPDLAPGELAEVTIALTIDARVFFSFSGEPESGAEEFILPAFLEREEGAERWVLRARFVEDGAGQPDWTEYLRERGVFVRYPIASAAFIIGYSPVLYLKPDRPDGIYAPGAWMQFDGPCQTYPEYYVELLGGFCEGIE